MNRSIWQIQRRTKAVLSTRNTNLSAPHHSTPSHYTQSTIRPTSTVADEESQDILPSQQEEERLTGASDDDEQPGAYALTRLQSASERSQREIDTEGGQEEYHLTRLSSERPQLGIGTEGEQEEHGNTRALQAEVSIVENAEEGEQLRIDEKRRTNRRIIALAVLSVFLLAIATSVVRAVAAMQSSEKDSVGDREIDSPPFDIFSAICASSDHGMVTSGELRERHARLHSTIIEAFPNTYDLFFDKVNNDDLPFDGSCIPENVAIMWVLTELIKTNGTSATNEVHLINRFVLAFLYAAWGGSTWTQSENLWMSQVSECTWDGVLCDELDSRIISLSRKNIGIHGSIESRIGLLLDLKVLDLADNSLRGSIPSEVWNLPKLEELSVGHNLIEGTLPSHFGDLGALTKLNLFDTYISGTIPAGIFRKTDLRYIDIHDTSVSGQMPADLRTMVALEFMDLSRNFLTGTWPESLSLLTNLKQVALGSTYGLSGTIPETVGNMRSLETMVITASNLSGTLPTTIGQLENLKWLNINAPGLNMQGPIPSEIGLCKSLQMIYIVNSGLTGTIPPQLGHLGALHTLDFSLNSELIGTVPPKFDDLQESFREIKLDGTGVTGSILPGSGR